MSYLSCPLRTISLEENARSEYRELMQRFSKLKKSVERELGSGFDLVDPRLDFNLQPEAFYIAPELNGELADLPRIRREAKAKGISGRYRLSDVKEFLLGGEALIAAQTLHAYSYYLEQSGKWKKLERTKEERGVDPVSDSLRKRIEVECPAELEKRINGFSKDHFTRSLIEQPPSQGIGYSFVANKRGDLFFYSPDLELGSPLEQSDSIGAQPVQRDFILPDQDGFHLNFRNIIIRKNQRVVFISASLDKQEPPFYEGILVNNLDKKRFYEICEGIILRSKDLLREY